MKNFRTYDLSKELYRIIENMEWPGHLRDQALRAASSIVLNVAEGAGLPSKKQKLRHYSIAMGSLCEVQAALDITCTEDSTKAKIVADQVAAHLFKLCESTSKSL